MNQKINIGFFSMLTLAFIVLSGISLGYLERLGLIESIYFDRPAKLISYGLIFSYVFALPNLWKYITSNVLLTFFLFWVFLASVISLLASSIQGVEVPFSNLLRTIEQLGGFLIGIALGFYTLRVYLEKPSRLEKAIHMSLIPVIAGVLWQITQESISGVLNHRLHGFTGEPKGLALFLVPYVIALSTSSLNNSVYRVLVLSSCLAMIILTGSSTGFLALSLMFFLYVTFFQPVGGRLSIINYILIILFGFTIFIYEPFRVLIFDRILDYSMGVYTEGIQMPLELPLVGMITVEANDYPVWRLLLNNPTTILTGVGLGQESIWSYRYIFEYASIGFLTDSYEGYITPNFALLQNIANFGFVCLILIIVIFFKMFFSLCRAESKKNSFVIWFVFSHYLISLLIFKTALPIAMSMSFLIGLYVFRERHRSGSTFDLSTNQSSSSMRVI